MAIVVALFSYMMRMKKLLKLRGLFLADPRTVVESSSELSRGLRRPLVQRYR